MRLNAPKLMAEMLSSEASYGWVHLGPPIRTRGGSSRMGAGKIEWRSPSYSPWYRSISVPKGTVSFTFFARRYTSERCWRLKGRPSVVRSMKYCCISGLMNSKK